MNEQFLTEMQEVAGVDFRAAVPPGTELGRQEIEPGGTAVWRKPHSLIRAGQRELPERVWLYDLTGAATPSFVPPTIAQKRITDYPGRYTLKEPQGMGEATPIDETCEICARRRRQESGAGPKKFYSHSDLIGHYRAFHTLEWEAIEQDRRERERREDQSQMRALIASIAAMVRPAPDIPAPVREQIEGLQEKPMRVRRKDDE